MVYLLVTETGKQKETRHDQTTKNRQSPRNREIVGQTRVAPENAVGKVKGKKMFAYLTKGKETVYMHPVRFGGVQVIEKGKPQITMPVHCALAMKYDLIQKGWDSLTK